jgi:hypothetical protein
VCELVLCTTCRLAEARAWRNDSRTCRTDPGVQLFREALQAGVEHVEAMRLRDATVDSQRRNLNTFADFAALIGEHMVPATRLSLSHFIVYSIAVREPPLDASSVITICASISAWHTQAASVLKSVGIQLENPLKADMIRALLKTLTKLFKRPSLAKVHMTVDYWKGVMQRGFDLGTRRGKLHQLLMLLATAGPFRPAALCRIMMRYEMVHGGLQTFEDSDLQIVYSDPWGSYVKITSYFDKNVVLSVPRVVYIPRIFMGYDVIALLTEYVVWAWPPSGGPLSVAPVGNWGAGKGCTTPQFSGGAFTNFGPAMKVAIKRAFPGVNDKLYGGGSMRKSCAQWLYIAGIPRTVIADIGGWKLSGRDAMDGYHSASYTQVLNVKADLEQRVAVAEARVGHPLPVWQWSTSVPPGEEVLQTLVSNRNIPGANPIRPYIL